MIISGVIRARAQLSAVIMPGIGQTEPVSDYQLTETAPSVLTIGDSGTPAVIVDTQSTLPVSLTPEGDYLLDYVIFGKTSGSSGVGDYDSVTGKYKIPVTVSNGTDSVTTSLLTTSPLMDGDVLSMADTQTPIPVVTGSSTLTIGTAVQPDVVRIVYQEGST